MKTFLCGILLGLWVAALVPGQALADGGVCPRPAGQTEIQQPPDIYSVNNLIDINLNYYTSMDDEGRTLFCFVTDDGKESPTLHVKPGDTIRIKLTNQVPDAPGAPSEVVSSGDQVCGDAVMTITSVNMHFHGTNTSPKCHSDEVIRTLINSGQTFQYVLRIPPDEPPGLYWYHPHVHGTSSQMVQGGSTGVIEVEGIENIQPIVAGLPQRYIVLRDQQMMGDARKGAGLPAVPNWDVSINYVPVDYPKYYPATITMQAGSQEFWRVVNAGANTIMNLQVLYDGVPQPLQIVAFDGVPTGSKDGQHQGSVVTEDTVILPPSGRVEFVVAAPGPDVQKAQLVTLGIDGGAAADSNPKRPFANILTTKNPVHLTRMPEPSGAIRKMRFDDLANAKVTAHRDLYFSEYFKSFGHDQERVDFFITVDGQAEKLFDPNNPPAITTTKGAVEEWRIENRTQELHEFHMHQIHFLVTAIDDVPIPKKKQQLYDVFQVGYWDGVSATKPSITVKLDFRGPTVGDFVYHCHILDHEDAGMMAIIRVLPRGTPASPPRAASAAAPVRLAAAWPHAVLASP
ncbi:MAG TPA: multicopper oxidase domain-containing protein [Rhizomicrobium sp.]|jgi:FtsP/CotA-like multicopper oxidase with cupredoxin domain|nr:multicopper oxidase domain-containing protein [Rhizomicrobium sp.]